MGREATCHAHHGSNFLDESVIVGDGGGLQNAFVWVRKGLEAWTFTAPAAAAVIGQENCVYVPHVLGLQVGQPLTVGNSDDFMHNVHGFAKKNQDFNFSQGGGTTKDLTFARAEVPLPLKCDVHGWMGAFLCVVDHPFFAVTGADGRFTLPKLPAGTYTLSVWHEVYGQKDQALTVAAGSTKAVEFSFSEDDE
jgi:plastocyanin